MGFYAGAIIATVVVFFLLKYAIGLSNKLEHFSVLDLNIKTNKPKEILDKVKKILSDNSLDLVKVKISDEFEEDKYIRILTKYKMKININDVILNISKIEEVKEVVEIIER